MRDVGIKHLTADKAYLHRLLYHGVKNRLVDIASGEASKPVLTDRRTRHVAGQTQTQESAIRHIDLDLAH